MTTFRHPRLRLSAISSLGAIALLVSASLGSSTVSATSASFSCSYDSALHRVTVSLTGDSGFNGVHLGRDLAGHINLENAWCGSAATVTNTDLIVVTGDAGKQSLWISLSGGGFRPGFSNETGTSNEIEFTVNLKGGDQDVIQIVGDDSVDNF
jgi:hypothetical protein